MQLLHVLTIPLAFIYYLAGESDTRNSEHWFSYFIGLCIAIPALAIGFLFVGLIPAGSTLWIAQFFRVFIMETLFPYGFACLAILVLESRFPSLRFHGVSLLFGIASYTVPFSLLTVYPLNDPWISLIVPLVSLSMLFVLDYCVSRRKKLRSYERTFFSEILLFPLSILIVGDICKTLWYFVFPWWILVLSIALISVPALILRLRKYF
jgi:hypothetical protein